MAQPYQWPGYPERPTPLSPQVPQPSGPQAPQTPYVPNADELARYVELGLLAPEEAENLRQQMLAEGASVAAGPEGRMVGSVYVAASPLEHLAAGLTRRRSAQRLALLRQEREALMGQHRAGLRAEQDIGQQMLGYPKPFGF